MAAVAPPADRILAIFLLCDSGFRSVLSRVRFDVAGFDCAALALASVASADPRPAAAFLLVLRRLVAFGVTDCGNCVFLFCGCLVD